MALDSLFLPDSSPPPKVKSTRGRKLLPEDQKRSEVIVVSVTKAEYTTIQGQAATFGLKAPEFLRRCWAANAKAGGKPD